MAQNNALIKRLIFLSFGLFLFIPLSSFAAVTYSRNPVGANIYSPITLNVSFDSFGEVGCQDGYFYWGIIAGYGESIEKVSNEFYPSSVNSKTFNLPIAPGSLSLVSFLCSIDGSIPEYLNPAVGNDLEGDGSYLIFTVLESRTQGTVTVYTPEIKMLNSVPSEVFSGPLEIKYEARDKDDELGKPDHGLKESPVNIYYNSSDEQSTNWHLIAENQPVSGAITWDTSKVRDGKYRLRLTASGIDGDSGRFISEYFIVDSSLPNFNIQIDRDFSKGEIVNFEIESSESLKDAPALSIIQRDRKPFEVELRGRSDFRKFTGSYRPIQGHDGLTKLFISGEDLAGNVGEAIIGEDSFWVGIEPPQAPTIKSPPNKIIITDNKIDIEGIAENAKKVIVKVNGNKENILEKIGRKGEFILKNIELEPSFNKGRNFISLVSEDFKGILSSPATLEILINSPPSVNLIEPKGRILRVNGQVRFAWSAFDINEDNLTYEVQLSDDEGNGWQTIGEDIKVKQFVWNSSEFRDGSNYLIKVIASDGTLKGEAKSSRITIRNDLPAITLEASGDFFTQEENKTFKGFVRSKADLLESLEVSFDNGKNWKEVLPEDSKWDSGLEKFSIALSNLKAGPKLLILKGKSRSGQIIVNAQQLKVFFDNKIPTFVSEDLSPKLSNKPYLKINGVAKDDFAGIKSVEYAIDDSAWFLAIIERGIETERAEFKISHSERLKDGEHEIKIRAIDRAGNISKVKSQKLFLDATPPRLGSFTLRSNNRILFPAKENIFKMSGLPTVFDFKLAIAGNPAKVEFLNNEEVLNLEFNPPLNLWLTTFVVKKENSVLKIKAEDILGNKVEKDIAHLVLGEKKPVKNPNFFKKILKLFVSP